MIFLLVFLLYEWESYSYTHAHTICGCQRLIWVFFSARALMHFNGQESPGKSAAALPGRELCSDSFPFLHFAYFPDCHVSSKWRFRRSEALFFSRFSRILLHSRVTRAACGRQRLLARRLACSSSPAWTQRRGRDRE